MKLNKITLGLLIASCAFATTLSANAANQTVEAALTADDNLNIIQGLTSAHMFSTDGGASWQAYSSDADNKFLGNVEVLVAKLDSKIVNSAVYDEAATYAKPGTLVSYDGYLWTNSWYVDPGQKPGYHPVWQREEAVKIVSLGTFNFTPFKGQQAEAYQQTLKKAVAQQRKVIGYFPEWGVYAAHNNFTPDKVAYNQISHLNYGFAVLTADGIVATHDTGSGPTSMMEIAERTKKAGVANIISVGGYTNSQICVINCDQSGKEVKMFQAATATPEKVERLANSIVDYMVKWKFDGVDIDWEYPTSEKEADQYTQLIKSLRSKLDELGKQNDRYYQLSSAVTANHNNIKYINPAETVPLLDSVNVMTYDYHGAFDPITGHNSPLYAHYNDTDAKFNIDSTMKEYNLQWNIPKDKLMVGLSWYGRAWGDVAGTEKVPGAPGLFNAGSSTVHGQWDDQNEYTGTNPYRLLKQMALDKQFQRYWDAQAHAPYLYNASEKTFYTYDDAQSIREKVDYIKNEGYGGAIIWDLSGDTDDHELGAISAELLQKAPSMNIDISFSQQSGGKIALNTTLDKDVFNAEKRIMFYANGVYQGESYKGKAYYSSKKTNNNTVTITTTIKQTFKPGDKITIILAEGKPGQKHSYKTDKLLKEVTFTADMLK